jgi:hypothetical protein
MIGCGNKVGEIELKEGKCAIYIDEDGKVEYGVAEKFAKDDYDEDELEEYINKEIDDYNNSSDASVTNAITLEKLNVKDKVAYLILNIETIYDFNNYITSYNKESEEQFYVGTIADRGDCKIKGKFTSPDGKKTAKASEIKKMSDSNIIIVNGEYSVQIEDDIKYISDNCKIDEDGIVTTATAEDGLSYIIY